MQVYAELVFLDNFIMDFVLCYLSVRLCGIAARPLRLILGAFCGGMYAALTPAFPWLLCIPAKLAVSVLMCAFSCGLIRIHGLRTSIKKFAAALICLYMSTFIAGGAMSALMYALKIPVVPGFIRLPYIRIILIAAAMSIAICEWIVRRKIHPHGQYEIYAVIGGSTVYLRGFVDTGNALCDLGGNGVIVADKAAVYAQLSDNIKLQIESGISREALKIRPFAIRSASGSSELTGIMPESITIASSKKNYAILCYIALADDIRGKDYNALLSENIRVFSDSKIPQAHTRQC